MDGESAQFLPRTGLTQDEDRRVRWGDLLRSIENILEAVAPEGGAEMNRYS